MTKLITILTACFIFGSCNPAKRMQRNYENAEKIASKVNSSKIIVPNDSIVYVKGDDVVKTDTIIENEIRYVYTNTHHTDTVKFFQRDFIRESALEKELVNANARFDSMTEFNKQLKRVTLYIAIGAGVLIALIFLGALLILKIFK